MSKRQHTLIIAPPTFCANAERIFSRGHECGYCHGRGSFVYDERWNDAVIKVCPVCKGKGKVDAMIDIKWQPSE